jgi:hypothetical protein
MLKPSAGAFTDQNPLGEFTGALQSVDLTASQTGAVLHLRQSKDAQIPPGQRLV